jgi:hypothetical protein
VDLEDLLQGLEIEVRHEPIITGAEGLSEKIEGRDLIILDPTIKSAERRRFTLAHELGHHLLGHVGQPCTPESIHGSPKDSHEIAANKFAATLLMPAKLFRSDIAQVHAQFAEISSVAALYGVSLTAASLRFVTFTRDACVLLGGAGKIVSWLSKSTPANGWWIERSIPEGSHLASVLQGEEPSSNFVPVRLWLENYRLERDCNILEEVVRTSSESWLTLLSELPDPDDDPDLDDREAQAELERRRRRFSSY